MPFESSGKNIPKRDFEKTVELYETKRGSSDYFEMVNDIQAVIDNWEDPSSESIKEGYPGWKKQDFKDLLKELGEQELSSSERIEEESPEEAKMRYRKEQIERQDQQAQEMRDKDEIVRIQKKLIELQQHSHDATPSEPSLEDVLAKAEKVLKALRTYQKDMGWFKRWRNPEEVEIVRVNIEKQQAKVTDLQDKIKNSPLEARLAQQTKDKTEAQIRSEKLIAMEEKRLKTRLDFLMSKRKK